MEYQFILEARLNQEILLNAALRWLRNLPPDAVHHSQLFKLPASGTARGPNVTTHHKPKSYRVVSPAHDIHSSHNMRVVRQITLVPGLQLRQISELGGHRRHFFVADSRRLLTIDVPSLHHRWQPLAFDWFRPLVNTMPAILPLLVSGPGSLDGARGLLSDLTDAGVVGMSATAKLIAAADLGMKGLQGQLAVEIWELVRKVFLTPEGLTFVIVATAAVLLFGEPVVLGLAVFGAAMGLFDLLTEVMQLFKQYYETASEARTRQELIRAGTFFSKAAAKGLLDLIDIFFSVRSSLRSVAIIAEAGWQPGVWMRFIEGVLTRWRNRLGGGQQFVPEGPGFPATMPPANTNHPPVLKSEGKPSGKTVSGPSRTQPSGLPNAEAKPKGTRAERPKKDKDYDNQRAANGEDRAADLLAQQGYDVTQKRPVTKDGKKQKTADYEVEGKDMDCVTPASSSPIRNVWSRVQEKVKTKQAQRVVLNLENWSGDVTSLERQFDTWPIDGLEEVIIINKVGKVQHIFP
ncbi:hypothetical protein ACAW74_15785 [Fibrella sp. WM1]|uniref:CdiA C-terminal domain-containing protein n=1 Tax=Fibrella musci TaxID=3242485 RepID=UPI003522B945